jgi:outer membrane receptor protein involved in Fe transport
VAADGASLRGLELSVRGDAGTPLQWLVNYTWSRATDLVSGVEVPRSWDQTHAGNVLVAYVWRSGWLLSVNGTLHTGWPTTPVTGRVVALPDGSTEIEPVLGPRNSTRFPTYARLDLKTGRSFQTTKGNVRLELTIVNVTDRENVCCLDEVQFQARPDGSIDTQRSYDTWMGITPSFQVLWTF